MVQTLIEQIKNTIQDGNINLFLGSGLSYPFLSTLGNIELLLTECDSATIDENQRRIIRASLYRRYFTEVIDKNRLILKADPSAVAKLEEYTAFLRSWNSILLNRKNTLLSKEINIFTTNIDIFPEMATESLDLQFNDGFNGRFRPRFSLSNYKQSRFKKGLYFDKTSELPVFNLIKLHGSLSWATAVDIVEFCADLKHIEKVSAVLPVAGACIDVPDGAKFADLLTAASGLTPHTSIDGFMSAYEELLIVVNPTKEKFKHTLLNQTYYELLRLYSNELEKENTVLLVFGFSFADEHIREITLRAANSNPTLMIYVFAYTATARAQIEANFGAVNIRNRNVKIVSPEQEADAAGVMVDKFSFDFPALNERVVQPLASLCESRQAPGANAFV